MADQLARPKDQMNVYWFSDQAQVYVSDGELEKFESGRLAFPNTTSTLKRPMCSTTSTTNSMRWPTR